MQLSLSTAKSVMLFGLLWPALALGAPQVPPSAPVTVVNTASNPVPVTGSTTVSGSVSIFGTVPVTQSGTWTVNANVQGTPAVSEVSKIPANLVELQCETRPLSAPSTCIAITPESSNGGAFTVPEGKQFVITTIDIVTGEPTAGQSATGNTEVVLFQHVLSDDSTRVRNRWVVSNTTPTVQLQFNSGMVISSGSQIVEEIDSGNFTLLTIHGYLATQ